METTLSVLQGPADPPPRKEVTDTDAPREPLPSGTQPGTARPVPSVPDAASALSDQRNETLHRLAQLEHAFQDVVAASVGSNADDEHDPEGTTIAFERSQLESLVRQARDHLREIDAATSRLAEGRYGVCERCGRPIDPERLAARPVARTCVTCPTR